jgi:hypothetical protein
MVAAELLCPKWTGRGCRLPLALHIRSVPRQRAERKENHEATSNGGESSYSEWEVSWRGDTTARARCTANEWPESVTKIVAALWRSLWHFVRARRGVGRYAATFLPGDKVPAVADRLTDVVPGRSTGAGTRSVVHRLERGHRVHAPVGLLPLPPQPKRNNRATQVAQLRQGIKALDLAESAPKDPPKDDPLRGDEQICSATKSFQRTPDRADRPF